MMMSYRHTEPFICTLIALNVVRGRVEACEIIYDPVENCKDNYVMIELNHSNNDEIMSSRVINLDH